MMQKKLLLTELIHDLEQEMLHLGYSDRSMRFYRRRWRTLLQFAKERDKLFYSEQLGIDFVGKHFNIFQEDNHRTLSESDVLELRVIRMIGDFQLHRTIFRRYSHHKKLLTNPSFITLQTQYELYCKSKKYAKTTTYQHMQISARFMDYLESQGIKNCKEVGLPLIHAYIKTLAGCAHTTIRHKICCIRTFLTFLLETGEIQTDFAAKIPVIQVRHQARIPSVWTKDELQKLIAVIDRGSPLGKRDYAIILLACCLGLRTTDIKNLKKGDSLPLTF